MTHLATLLHGVLPWLSTEGRRVIDLVAAHRGRVHSPEIAARALGLTTRHQLRRMLERERLPCLEVLCGWTRVLTWVEAWETRGQTLSDIALTAGEDPAVLYRTVRRMTGLSWTEACDTGSAMLALRFGERCRLACLPEHLVSAILGRSA